MVSMPIARLASSVPSTAADCSPEPIPDRGAESNLFIAGPRLPHSVPAELLQHTKGPGCLHHHMHCHAASALEFTAANRSYCWSRCRCCWCRASKYHIGAPCVARPVHVSPPNASPHMSTASSSLANISRRSLLLTTCSLSQRLTTPSAFQSIASLFNWVAHKVRRWML